MSNKKMICQSYQRSNGENRDYCRHFSVTIEPPSISLIVFVTWILRRFDDAARPQRGIDIRYEFHLKVILKSLGCK